MQWNSIYCLTVCQNATHSLTSIITTRLTDDIVADGVFPSRYDHFDFHFQKSACSSLPIVDVSKINAQYASAVCAHT